MHSCGSLKEIINDVVSSAQHASTTSDARRMLNLKNLYERYINSRRLIYNRMKELEKIGLKNTYRYRLLNSMYIDIGYAIREIKKWL